MSPRGGYRVWRACPGSHKPAGKILDHGVGACRACGKVLTVFPSGKIVRHKREEDS